MSPRQQTLAKAAALFSQSSSSEVIIFSFFFSRNGAEIAKVRYLTSRTKFYADYNAGFEFGLAALFLEV